MKCSRRGRMIAGIACLCVLGFLTGCGQTKEQQEKLPQAEDTLLEDSDGSAVGSIEESFPDAVEIFLSDSGITVNGEIAPMDNPSSAVYTAHDIVYYEAGNDFTYGEGTAEDEHTKEEADAHTVVHITQPGTYVVSGSLSAGQIAVDLGEDAKEDPQAVVTLVLNNAEITCTVAPAVIFYNVYECCSTEEGSKDVDTSSAGANVIIADGTQNDVTGSYVARIYKSYELSKDGTEVVDSKKLHKYDGAFYSKMSMNITGGEEGSGVLNIKADNEGLGTELHLTVNGGIVNIISGNDGINTNEDGISVTTINGGVLNILVDGATGEGDGIDSNGWLVINGGTVAAQACDKSADAGIDSDMGIHINGGTVAATGNMLDHISESNQNYVVFSFQQRQKGSVTYVLKDEAGETVAECTPENDFTYLVISAPQLTAGNYSLWAGEVQLSGAPGEGGMGGMIGKPSGHKPDGFEPGRMPEGMEPGQKPEGFVPGEIPDGNGEQKPDGGRFSRDGFDGMEDLTLSQVFEIKDGGSYFMVVKTDNMKE